MRSSLAGTSHYIKRFTRVYSSAQICHYSTPERRTIELLPAAPGELYAVRGEKASCWLQPTNSPQSISIRRLHNQHSAILEPQHIPRTVDEWQPPRSIIIEGNNRERERERERISGPNKRWWRNNGWFCKSLNADPQSAAPKLVIGVWARGSTIERMDGWMERADGRRRRRRKLWRGALCVY